MRPADNGHAKRFTMDGTAMASDDDATVAAYEKGVNDGRLAVEAIQDAEERRWRLAFAAALATIAGALVFLVLGQRDAVATQHQDAEALLRAMIGGK